MFSQRFIGEKVELSGGRVRFDLAIPSCMIILDEPLAQLRERLLVEALDLLLNAFNFGHAVLRSKPIVAQTSPTAERYAAQARPFLPSPGAADSACAMLRCMEIIEAEFDNGVLRPVRRLPLRPGERVGIVVVRRPDLARWDLDRLSKIATADDKALAEEGLGDWAAARGPTGWRSPAACAAASFAFCSTDSCR
jgi:predicted DNA-binding antitoxin AbrB/MazE fold protein